jgi:hypothetical protein
MSPYPGIIKTQLTTEFSGLRTLKIPNDKTEHLNHHGDLLVLPTAEDEVD